MDWLGWEVKGAFARAGWRESAIALRVAYVEPVPIVEGVACRALKEQLAQLTERLREIERRKTLLPLPIRYLD